jgi:FAD synthase
LLKRIQRLARQYDGESVVVTFDPHPRQVLSQSGDTLRLLTTTEEKLEYLREYGVDNVVIIPFTIEFSQIGPREYVERFLIDRFKTRCLVV